MRRACAVNASPFHRCLTIAVHSPFYLRKAAVLLTSLPAEEAANLLKRLKPKQVEAVSVEIARLGALGSDEQETTITEFAESNPNALGGEAGGVGEAGSVAAEAIWLSRFHLNPRRRTPGRGFDGWQAGWR